MKGKIKDCQDIRVRSYQYQDAYKEGDKIWYQYKDMSAWYGPALVICQRGNSVFIHCNGEVRKVAACRAKPCELMERKKEKKEEQSIEDDEKKDIEKEEEIEEEDMVMTEDGLKDAVGAKYLKNGK